MRAFVPTPDAIVDAMVAKLFAFKAPTVDDALLDPGCGPGAFISGIIRWAERNGRVLPRIVGYESEPGRHAQAVRRFRHLPNVRIICGDFLTATEGPFDYIIGNPPYVPITELSNGEKSKFRRRFISAEGRFDLYLLFFEQALRWLSLGGRLVFVTPEKFLYVNTARSFRRILANYHVREIELLNEDTFGDLVTYPTVTTIDSSPDPDSRTKIRSRNGSQRCVLFPKDGSSLQPLLHDYRDLAQPGAITLGDVCSRISCGVATGADSIFVRKTSTLDPELARYSYPTISGRDLSSVQSEVRSDKSMLIPYDRLGTLLPLSDLGPLRMYLSQPEIRQKLEGRTCVGRKPWYAFHDSVPLPEILRPKLICKDITASPCFWIDANGALVPRHSVYYAVPVDPAQIKDLCEFLNGATAANWLRAHCQRASKGFLRLQSSVLKHLPVPACFASAATLRSALGDEKSFATLAAAV
jgi:adenine-specific DNA-methyltransferase